MLHTLAVSGYRSLREIVLPLGQLTLVTGPNGSGKSNLYRALRLLSDAATGRTTASLAREGGLSSVFWAGPETIRRDVRSGERETQGTKRKRPVRVRLGFAGDDIGYAAELGMPPQTPEDTSMFVRDPEFKREAIWHGGGRHRPATAWLERRGAAVSVRGDDDGWATIAAGLSPRDSVLSELADPTHTPEVIRIRDAMRSWRFYDHLRVDVDAPIRRPQIGTFTPVLAGDGSDLAAALQTIIEAGDAAGLVETVDDAFPGTQVEVVEDRGWFRLHVRQPGLLRPLAQAELSDGTLRYLAWVAALLTPRPPTLMVLNEPETSLQPELLPALARLIDRASRSCQLWIVSHARGLVEALEERPQCRSLRLRKELGETIVDGIGRLEQPPWAWPGA